MYGLGEFLTPLAPFVDFGDHPNIPFFLYCENWNFTMSCQVILHHEVCFSDEVKLEDSRSPWSSWDLLHFVSSYVGIIFSGGFESRRVFTQPLVLERKVRIEGEGMIALLKFFSCHNLIMKVRIPQAHFFHVVFHA